MKVAATIRDEIINSFVQSRNPSLMSTVRGGKNKNNKCISLVFSIIFFFVELIFSELTSLFFLNAAII